jgi:cytochrome d ubiquinol oxidase subunit II
MLDAARALIIPDLSQPAGWLPLAFALVMALAMLAYVILDGYDLGVGVLLVAFPVAHGVILGALYLPVALMLMALTLRGVAFDFRVKARAEHKPLWDRAFYAGSLLAGWSQGFMLGGLVSGFATDWGSQIFNALIGFCLVAAYCLLGAGWLIMKTEGALQHKAVRWAQGSLWFTAAGVAAISLATPWVSQRIFDKWFAFPNVVMLLPIPLMTLALFVVMARSLKRLPTRLAQNNQYGAAVPFACTVGVFLLAFYGLAYSLFPWLVVDKITLWQAASAPEALQVIFYGVVVVLPVIIGYTVFAYRVFWGKSTALKY